MTAVGVAKISGQGQATTKTASAGRKPFDHSPVDHHQPTQRDRGPAEDCRQKQSRQAVGRSFQRRLAFGGLAYQPNDLGERRLVTDFLGHDRQRAELIERAGEDLIAFQLVDRQTLARQRALIDTGLSGRNAAVDGNAFAGSNDDHVSDDNFADRHVRLTPAAQHVRLSRTEVKNAADGPLRPVDGVTFEALAAQCDKHDQCGRRVLPQQDRGQRGNSEGQIGADLACQEALESLVQNPGPAQHRCQQSQPVSPRRAIRLPLRQDE